MEESTGETGLGQVRCKWTTQSATNFETGAAWIRVSLVQQN